MAARRKKTATLRRKPTKNKEGVVEFDDVGRRLAELDPSMFRDIVRELSPSPIPESKKEDLRARWVELQDTELTVVFGGIVILRASLILSNMRRDSKIQEEIEIDTDLNSRTTKLQLRGAVQGFADFLNDIAQGTQDLIEALVEVIDESQEYAEFKEKLAAFWRDIDECVEKYDDFCEDDVVH